jgi:hypothetical protein
MKAKRIPVEATPPPDNIELTLTLAEAELLKRFAGRVGGISNSGDKYYKLFSTIHRTLHDVNVRSSDTMPLIESHAGEYLFVGHK